MAGSVCIGFESAQEAWRLVGMRVAQDNPPANGTSPLLVRLLFETGEPVDMGPMPARSRATKIPSRVDVTALSDLRRAEPELAATPRQLCVSSRNGRRFVSAADCRLVTGSYPIGSFYRLSDGALLASPELAFLQMARELDFDLLVLYGHELCGYFARTSQDPGFVNCPPLTSAARIAEYLDRLEALRQERGEGMPWGLGPARRALRHIRDHVASPEEAVVSMVLTLPCRLGGYGLPPAALNERARLSTEAARLFGIDSFVCDLSWDGGRVLEYQGSQHKIRSRRAYDMRKGNVLAADGRSVVEMDRSMLSRQDLMDEVAKSVTRLLGLTRRAPGAKLATRRARLRNKLIAHIDER